MTTLVFTLVGDDRSGLVEQVAAVVAAHEGNWEHSRLARLAGAFAGVVQVGVPEERADALRTALGSLDGLTVTAHAGGGTTLSEAPIAEGPERTLVVSVLGNDRPGIVREVSQALREAGLSILELETGTRDAAMSGGMLFEARATASVPAAFDLDPVRAALEALAAEIQVDLALV